MPRFAFLLILLFSFHPATSQLLPLDTYSPSNGLIDARISKMFQDSKGLLYFLSPEGFSVYDGQHFDNYSSGTQYGTGIMSDITEYKNGLVKVFSYDGDILTLENNHLKIDTSKRSLFKEISEILTIGPDDKIFITNYHMVRETRNQIQILRQGSIKPGFIECSMVYGNQLILVETGEDKTERLYLYDYIHQKTEYSLPVKKTISFIGRVQNQILMASDGRSWFSFNPKKLKEGIIELNPFKDYGSESLPFQASKIQYLSPSHALWFINSQKGYCRLNLLNQSKEYFLVSDGLYNTTNWVFEDAEKNYWFGSTARGVQKLQWTPLVLKTKASGQNLGYVHSINTTEKGYNFISSDEGVFINEKKVNPFLKANSAFVFWDNQYWQFSDYKTLKGSHGTIFHLEKLIPGYKKEDFLFGHSDIDSDGRLRIAGRVFLFIDKKHHFNFFRPGYFGDNIFETKKGEFGCFLRSNRFIKLKWERNTIKKVYEQFTPNLAPRFAIRWDSNTFFVATRLSGLKIYKWYNGKLQEKGGLDKSKGLSNNFVYVLLRKDQKHLILGTSSGLDQITISLKDTLVENLSQRMNIFTPFTDLIQLGNGEILCKTIDGQLFNFKKEYHKPSNFYPKAIFKSIRVNNHKIDFSLKNEFQFDSNNFLFTARTPTYFDNKKIGFSYLLKKDKEVWQQNLNNPDFEIKNLQPGFYILNLTIQYPGKIYPNAQLQYNFRIKPPFYQTWWFILGLLILVLSTIIYSIRWFYNRQYQKQINELEKQYAVDKERTRIATDMHDDFGASLSRIKFISEKIQILNRTDENLNIDLSKISIYTDEMSEKMNEIVWALNQRNDSLEDLISFSRAYAADYLQDKGIKLVFNADNIANLKIQGEVRRNIFMVIKEALNNIIKHSEASSVLIEFKVEKDLEIRIHDNGKGILIHEIRPFANGLENMKKRIKDIGGQIQFQNSQGTNIILKIPY